MSISEQMCLRALLSVHICILLKKKKKIFVATLLALFCCCNKKNARGRHVHCSPNRLCSYLRITGSTRTLGVWQCRPHIYVQQGVSNAAVVRTIKFHFETAQHQTREDKWRHALSVVFSPRVSSFNAALLWSENEMPTRPHRNPYLAPITSHGDRSLCI